MQGESGRINHVLPIYFGGGFSSRFFAPSLEQPRSSPLGSSNEKHLTPSWELTWSHTSDRLILPRKIGFRFKAASAVHLFDRSNAPAKGRDARTQSEGLEVCHAGSNLEVTNIERRIPVMHRKTCQAAARLFVPIFPLIARQAAHRRLGPELTNSPAVIGNWKLTYDLACGPGETVTRMHNRWTNHTVVCQGVVFRSQQQSEAEAGWSWFGLDGHQRLATAELGCFSARRRLG